MPPRDAGGGNGAAQLLSRRRCTVLKGPRRESGERGGRGAEAAEAMTGEGEGGGDEGIMHNRGADAPY